MAQLLRRPLVASVVVMGALLVAGLAAIALGADGVGMVLGATVVAVAFAAVVGVWLRPARREARRARRRERRQAEQRARKQAKKMRRIVSRAETRLFSQLEALDWLRDQLQLRRPLPPTRGFAAAPDALLELVRIVDEVAPEAVVELGSGVSTLVIGRRLQQAGRGRIVAVDHLPEYAEQTRARIVEQGLEDVASVLVAPLGELTIDGKSWRWYQLAEGLPGSIDVLFVDGPPGATGPEARYPALPVLRDRLAPGCIVFVDDGDRPDEKAVAKRWAAEVEGTQLRYLPLAKGAWVLTMPR